MKYYLAALAGSLAVLAHAAPSVVVESTKNLPAGWSLKDKAPLDAYLSVSIALAQPKLTDLESALLEQAAAENPFITLFSHDQVEAFQKPADEAPARVLDWLAEHKVTGATVDGAWVRLNTTVDTLQKLFKANIGYYTYSDGGDNDTNADNTTFTVLRTASYSIPKSLVGTIEFVYPLAHFMPPTAGHRPDTTTDTNHRRAPRASKAKTAPACVEDHVTPACIREVYKWDPYSTDTTAPATSRVRLGVAGFLDEYIDHRDVDAFLRTYAPGVAPGYTFSVELVHGGQNVQTEAGSEASLDVEYAMALAYPAQVVYYSTGGRATELGRGGEAVVAPTNEPYLHLLEYLVALPDDRVPHVLSISYSDDEQSVPRAYAERVCRLFMQLAARGTSVLVASGDGGSRGIGKNMCHPNDGPDERTLLPTFPGSCPWVTAVGATEMPVPRDAKKKQAKQAPPKKGAAYSSGGFSNYFARPAWQEGHASVYTESPAGTDKTGLFNTSGRGIPDISAMGTGFDTVWGGRTIGVTGTSASTPVVAAMVALADDARLRAGKPALGWLNPLLYAHAVHDTLQDITEGVSLGCPFHDGSKAPGWPAVPGWDAVTGLGVPSDYPAFAKALIDV